MLKNKNIQAILSLLVAIALWIYVMGSVDPTVTTTIHNVPVEKANEEVLEDLGMTATLNEPESIDITIRGARSDVNEAKKSKVTATVDVSNCDYGKNQAPISVDFADKVTGIRIEDLSEDTATFTVE